MTVDSPKEICSDATLDAPGSTLVGGVEHVIAVLIESQDPDQVLADLAREVRPDPGQDLRVRAGRDGARVVRAPFPYVNPLLHQSGIEIRVLDLTEQPSILHRFDQHILLIARLLIDQPAESTPALIHLGRTTPGGLFDRLAAHLDHAWEHNSERLTQRQDSNAEYDEDTVDEPENEGESYPRNLEAESPNVHAADAAASAPRH